ncbi:PIG-L family deacetylase [Sphingobacterium lactis]|uniref:PIG-L family deacetylase n=1 Tax=Sphingobacterium lactis TaxID=797291 RepID=UPI003F7CE98A
MTLRTCSLLLYFLFQSIFLYAQNSSNAAQIKLKIDRLNSLGSVLYFAAHPDDENTKLIAWLANEKKYKTAYLSLTRGDGGQNLLGTEQGIELGLIRTQELLAARNIDRGEQYFTSAFDFGFSKTHEETFNFWKKNETLREAVYLIRKLQPDVIITRFPPDSRGGHGHHQASAILAHEAFLAAADPSKFPEQLKTLKPWNAKRLVWNTANFGGMNNTSEDQLKVNIGQYNPLLGYSYGEIAALSRSQHKSQGFGAASQRGETIEYFDHVAGDKANTDLFEGIKTDWSRLDEPTSRIQELIKLIQQNYKANSPDLSIPDLVKLHKHINQLKDSFWKKEKLQEVEQLLIDCAGLHMTATSKKALAVMQEEIPIQLELISRSNNIPVILKAIDGDSIKEISLPVNKTQTFTIQKSFANNTQPYWLVKPHTLGKFDVAESDFGYPENNEKPKVTVQLDFYGEKITLDLPIVYRYVDPVHGEILEPLSISPIITAALSSSNLLLQANENKSIRIQLQNHSNSNQKGNLQFQQSDGLVLQPNQFEVEIPAGGTWEGHIQVSNPKNSPSTQVGLLWNAQPLMGYHKISYNHIPSITWFPPISLQVKSLEITNPVKRIAYIPGAGDLIPQSLENIGIQVDVLNPDNISMGVLKPYDAVVVGVRAYNVSNSVNRWLPQLIKYVEDGGVAVVQYNVNSRMGTTFLGPYPFQISRTRVTEEDAEVKFTDPKDPVLNYPNKITKEDFKGWVQERGLYFAEQIDPQYRSPLLMNDKNEAASNGSLILAKHGKGKFVYTSLAFFRQLPAGVPGAYRLFVNLLTKEEK